LALLSQNHPSISALSVLPACIAQNSTAAGGD